VRAVHAARPGLTGDHRTDGIGCRCDPWQLVDMNEPGRLVIVHRPFDADTVRSTTVIHTNRTPFHPERLP
jgi:hypothetical protein